MPPASTPGVSGGQPGTDEICTLEKSGLFCINNKNRPTPLMLLPEAGIVRAQLGSDAGLIGAAELARSGQ